MIDFDENDDGIIDITLGEAVAAAGIMGAAYEELSEEEIERRKAEKEDEESAAKEIIEEAIDEFETQKAIGDFDIEKERARATPLKKGPRINLNPNRREPDFEQWVMDVALGKKDVGED